MTKSDLKSQAIKMGLQVGAKIATYKVTNKVTKEFEQKYVGRVTTLYDYVFTVQNAQGKKEKIKESFQYGQVVLTKEVRLVDKSRN